jgi:two-component system, NarL family, nitrate/nitrite response regulator NarL
MTKKAVKTIRILLVDDHVLFRESVARLLQAEPGFEVVGGCSTGDEALRLLKTHESDIVLLDVDLGAERGGDVLESLRAQQFNAKVLLVTAGVNEAEIPGLIRKGIAGVFLKHDSPSLLIQGIREAMDGKALFGQEQLRRALESAAQSTVQNSGGHRLTERERRVLGFVLEGLANKQIGDRLQISESAVKACLQQLFNKTGVRTRSQLVRIALEQYRDQL